MIQAKKYQLDNGLNVVLVPSKQSPVVSINICIKVGSVYEQDHEAGLSHLIEHMLFKGTPSMGPGEMAAIIESCGGDVNAYTSFDETVYYCSVAKDFAQRGLAVLADGVLNSIFDEEELEREKIVVLEELKRGKDSPSRLLSEELFSTVYKKHNYGRPIIGFEETIDSFDRKKILEYYQRWYTPNNMVVVMAGDFEVGETKKQIKQIFGKLKVRKTPKINSKPETKKEPKQGPGSEPGQKQVRTGIIREDFRSHLVNIAFPACPIEHEDTAVLDVISHLLGEADGSRLDSVVRNDLQIVNSVYSYLYAPKFNGLFCIGASLKAEHWEEAISAICQEIWKLKEKGIGADELARAKLNIKSSGLYELETVEGLARKYGYFENILGDFNYSHKYFDLIEQVDLEKVQVALDKYFVASKMSITLLTDKKSKLKVSEAKLKKLCQETQSKKPTAQKNKDTLKNEDTLRKVTLSNGLRLILQKKDSVPLVSIRTAHLGGLRSETPANNGISYLFSQVWDKATVNRSQKELVHDIEDIAAAFDSFTGRNTCGLKADFLKEKQREALKIFFELYLEPRFDESDIDRERKIILESIKRSEDDLSGLCVKQFNKKLFGKHPYALPMIGTAASIKKIKRQDLLKYHSDLVNPSNSMLSIAGDIDFEEIVDLFEARLGHIKAKKKKSVKVSKIPALVKKTKIIKNKNKNQSHILYGFPGLSIKDPDRYALSVLNNILAGQGGRLFIELRDKHSLAYSVTAFHQEGLEPGYFAVYIATDPNKIDFAIEKIEEELQKISELKVSREELERSKQYIIGNHEIDLQRNAAVANEFLFNEIYDIKIKSLDDYAKKIRKVTAKQVLEIAQKYIDLKKPLISIVK